MSNEERLWDISYALENIAKAMEERNKIEMTKLILEYGEKAALDARERV